jgi:hypothetical protein
LKHRAGRAPRRGSIERTRRLVARVSGTEGRISAISRRDGSQRPPPSWRFTVSQFCYPFDAPAEEKGMRYATRSTDHPSFPALPLRESCHVAWSRVLLSRFVLTDARSLQAVRWVHRFACGRLFLSDITVLKVVPPPGLDHSASGSPSSSRAWVVLPLLPSAALLLPPFHSLDPAMLRGAECYCRGLY